MEGGSNLIFLEPAQQANTACSACHRRKLKCDRNIHGCETCRKSDIPCLYFPHGRGVDEMPNKGESRKNPRGPYKKGKTAREKELENLVQMLRDRCDILENQVRSDSSRSSSMGGLQGATPESSLAIDNLGNLAISPQPFAIPDRLAGQVLERRTANTLIHPSASQILELWLIYTSRVDPLTKLIHCPSIEDKILHVTDHLYDLEPSTEALMLGIYLASLNCLDSAEVMTRFKARKEDLTQAFQYSIDHLIAAASAQHSCSFEMLQAIVIHMSCRRRQPGPANDVPTLLEVAISFAHRLKLNDPASYKTLSPFEAEYRRRTWWTICRNEVAQFEELKDRPAAIVEIQIPLPVSLDDIDLNPSMTSLPVPRTGLSEMSLPLIMFEARGVVGYLRRFAQKAALNAGAFKPLQQARESKDIQAVVGSMRDRIEKRTLLYCDASRPLDWLIMLTAKVMLAKVEIMVLQPPADSNPSALDFFHDAKVALSLDIIECTLIVMREERLKMYRWYYRNMQQWFATIYVLEEVARRPGAPFAQRVWHLINLIFSEPDVLNRQGAQFEYRVKLLNAHGKALEARETLLRQRATVSTAEDATYLPHSTLPPSAPKVTRKMPWDLETSRTDPGKAKMNVDAIFWPSVD